jgi:hypothetical protein
MTTENRTHRVQSGDSLWKIAANFKREHSDNRSIQDIITQIRELNRDHIGQNDRILANRNITLNLPEPALRGNVAPAAAPAAAPRPAASATPRPNVTTTNNPFIIRRENRPDGPHYDTVSTIAAAWVRANPELVGPEKRFANVAAVQSEILQINGLHSQRGVSRCGTVIDGVVYLTPRATLYLPEGNSITPPPLVHGRDCGPHRERSTQELRAMVTTPVTAIFNPRTVRETNGTFPQLDPNQGRILATDIGGANSFILWHAGPADRVAARGGLVETPDPAANGLRTRDGRGGINADHNSVRGTENEWNVENGGRARGRPDQGNDRRLAVAVGPRVRTTGGATIALGADFWRIIDRDVIDPFYRNWLRTGFREGQTGAAVFADIANTAEGIDALNHLTANFRALEIRHGQLPQRLRRGAPEAERNSPPLSAVEAGAARSYFNLMLQQLANPIVWDNSNREGMPGWIEVTRELEEFMKRLPAERQAEFRAEYRRLGLQANTREYHHRNPNELISRAQNQRHPLLTENPYHILVHQRAQEPHVQRGLGVDRQLSDPARRQYWNDRFPNHQNNEAELRIAITSELLMADGNKRMAPNQVLRGATQAERRHATGVTRAPEGNMEAAQASRDVGYPRHLLQTIAGSDQALHQTLQLMATTPGGAESLFRLGMISTAGNPGFLGIFGSERDAQAQAIGGFRDYAHAMTTMQQLGKDLLPDESHRRARNHFVHHDPDVFERLMNAFIVEPATLGLVTVGTTENSNRNQQEIYQAQMREILSNRTDPRYARLMDYARQMYRHAAEAPDPRPMAALATPLGPQIHADRGEQAQQRQRFPDSQAYREWLQVVSRESGGAYPNPTAVRRAAEVQEAIAQNNFTHVVSANHRVLADDALRGTRSRLVHATPDQVDAHLDGSAAAQARAAGNTLRIAGAGAGVNVLSAGGQTDQQTRMQEILRRLNPRDRAMLEEGKPNPASESQMNAIGAMLAARAARPADRNVSRTQYDALLSARTGHTHAALFTNTVIDALSDPSTRVAMQQSLREFGDRGGQSHRDLANTLLAQGEQMARIPASQRAQRAALLEQFTTSALNADEQTTRALFGLTAHLSATNASFNRLLSGRVGMVGENSGAQITRMISGLPEDQRRSVAQSLLALANGQQTTGQTGDALGMFQGQMQALLSHPGVSYVEIGKVILTATLIGVSLGGGGGGGGGGGTPLSPFRPEDPTKPRTLPIPGPSSGPPGLPPIPGGGFLR